MANIFSGLFAGGGGSNAAALAQYKSRLEEYERQQEYKKRNEDLISQSPAFATAIEQMAPERQAQQRLFQSMAGGQTTGDKGLEGMISSFKQRGTTIADIAAAKETRETNRLKEIDKRETHRLADPDLIKTAKKYMGLSNWNKAVEAMNGDDPVAAKAAAKSLQQVIRDVKRQRQYLSNKISDIDPMQLPDDQQGIIPYETIQAGVDEKQGGYVQERLVGFLPGINEMEKSLQATAGQRRRVQYLHQNAEGNTGWWGLAAAIPDIKSEDGSRQWKEVKATLIGNIGLETLIELKKSSAQGASGLGALNREELEMLQKHKGSLEQANSPHALKKVLLQMDKDMDRLQKKRMRLLKTERDWYNRNKRRIGEDPKMPANIPSSQLYLFSDDPYKAIEGTSPLDKSDERSGIVKKYNLQSLDQPEAQ